MATRFDPMEDTIVRVQPETCARNGMGGICTPFGTCMDEMLFDLLLGCMVGAFIMWVLIGRAHVKTAVFDELERHHKAKMRAFLGDFLPVFKPPSWTISPTFCEIFLQAAEAESYSLHQISGLGYVKALELLVKDFAKLEQVERSAEIERLPLAACIRQFITDPTIQRAAEIVAWVPDDEARSVRRFEQRDVQDLKRLIALVIESMERTIRQKERGLAVQADVDRAIVRDC